MSDLDVNLAERERFGEYLIFYGPHGGGALDECVVMEFVVLEIAGEEMSPLPGLLFHKEGWTSSEDDTHDPNEAEHFWDGSIKWDGCSNWSFNTERCMAHFCGVQQAGGIGALMRRMYEITAAKMPKFDREIADMDASAPPSDLVAVPRELLGKIRDELNECTSWSSIDLVEKVDALLSTTATGEG